MAKVTVIGVGNPLRGDDGAGIAVVRALRARWPRAEIRECGGETTELLELFGRAENIVVVDAVAGGAPGTVRWIEPDAAFADARATSSHGLGLAESIALGRALGRLPDRLSILGIEGDRFEVGTPMGPAVERAVGRAVALLEERLGGDDA